MDKDKVSNNRGKKNNKNKITFNNKRDYMDINDINIITEKKKTNPRVKDKDFKILDYLNCDKLHNYNYTLLQLKSMCKYYNLKVSGNKSKLISKIHQYLTKIKATINIRKIYKGYIVRKYINSHGEGFKNKDICVNDTDFYTLEKLKFIPHYQFFSYRNDKGFIYGFDICSLYNYIQRDNTKIINPYNREIFNKDLEDKLTQLIKYCNILKYPLNLVIDDIVINQTPDKILNNKIVSLFSKMDEYGFYTDPNWLISLNRTLYIRFIREIEDIWNYRSQITKETKLTIYPHHNGNPFHAYTINDIIHNNYSSHKIKSLVIDVIDNIINNGQDNSSKWLGASYCLSALTLVNYKAAEALPWLYESVLPEIN